MTILNQPSKQVPYLTAAVVLSALFSGCEAGCAAGWTQYSSNSHCYKLLTTPVTGSQALSSCQAARAEAFPVVIDRGSVKNYVTATFNSVPAVWIGVNMTSQGAYQWMNGDLVFTTFWGPNQPDVNSLSGLNQQCVQMGMTVNTGEWDDVDCDNVTAAVVCEYFPSEVVRNDMYFPMDEMNVATDQLYDVDMAPYPVYNNPVLVTDAMNGSSLSLDSAVNQHVDLGEYVTSCYGDVTKCPEGFSLSFWIKTDVPTNYFGDFPIINNQDLTSGAHGFNIYYDGCWGETLPHKNSLGSNSISHPSIVDGPSCRDWCFYTETTCMQSEWNTQDSTCWWKNTHIADSETCYSSCTKYKKHCVNGITVELTDGSKYFKLSFEMTREDWHHIGVAYMQPGILFLYRDGERGFHLGSPLSKPNPTSSRILIGKSVTNQGDKYGKFRLDELKFYNRFLLPDEIKYQYLRGYSFGCHDGWFGHDGACYLFHPAPKIQYEAEIFCRQFGTSRLITVSSLTEAAFLTKVTDVMNNLPSGGSWFVGLEFLCGDWHWYTDTTQGDSWSGWQSGEPSDQSKACAVLVEDSSITSDVDCTTKHPFVCQAPHSDGSDVLGWAGVCTTRDSTTEALTTAAPTTTLVTTEAPTTTQPTTEAPTTTKPTTEAPTTTPPTTTEAPTTTPSTTGAPTSLPSATEAATTTPSTTEAPTSIPSATEGPTTPPMATEAPTTAQPTTEVPTTAPLSTDASATTLIQGSTPTAGFCPALSTQTDPDVHSSFQDTNQVVKLECKAGYQMSLHFDCSSAEETTLVDCLSGVYNQPSTTTDVPRIPVNVTQSVPSLLPLEETNKEYVPTHRVEFPPTEAYAAPAIGIPALCLLVMEFGGLFLLDLTQIRRQFAVGCKNLSRIFKTTNPRSDPVHPLSPHDSDVGPDGKGGS